MCISVCAVCIICECVCVCVCAYYPCVCVWPSVGVSQPASQGLLCALGASLPAG